MNEMEKITIRLAVETALLEIGVIELEKVESRLLSKHNCKLENCMDYPEALKNVLVELYGNSYNKLFESIMKSLKKTASGKPIQKFINILRN